MLDFTAVLNYPALRQNALNLPRPCVLLQLMVGQFIPPHYYHALFGRYSYAITPPSPVRAESVDHVIT